MNHQNGFPWHPMQSRRRNFVGYSPRQEARWHAMDAVYLAMTYGRETMLRPSPHFQAEPAAFELWKHLVIRQWYQESRRDTKTTTPGTADIPEHLWLWWYEAMAQTKDLPFTVALIEPFFE